MTATVISGWGRYPVTKAVLFRPPCINEVALPKDGTLICRGQGRSYGDAAISSRGLVLLTEGFKRVHRFDAATGVLTAEAGMTIGDILREFVPRGWFPPVTPGTKHVSLGGAVAADIHGKNHHRDGTLGNHITELELMLADGSRPRCGPTENSELFWATVGGLGLTGMITKVTVQLIPVETPYIVAQHLRAPNLEAAFSLLEDSRRDDHYTVAWIDCLARGRKLGRSIVMRGHHARHEDLPAGGIEAMRHILRLPLQIPFDCPSFFLNPITVGIFNRLYYAIQGRKDLPFLIDHDRFFYPLDAVGNWNRMYGKSGFLQYQVVIPERVSAVGIRSILERLVTSRRPSFLAVLKRFGSANPGPLSFPAPGYTLSLDLPMTGNDVLCLLDELDEMVLRFGGRVYLAKDARLAPKRLRAMYPRLDEWLRIKHAVDPRGRFSSDLSFRLGLDSAA
jgi:FAD/FMN-containing dehydrogenase